MNSHLYIVVIYQFYKEQKSTQKFGFLPVKYLWFGSADVPLNRMCLTFVLHSQVLDKQHPVWICMHYITVSPYFVNTKFHPYRSMTFASRFARLVILSIITLSQGEREIPSCWLSHLTRRSIHPCQADKGPESFGAYSYRRFKQRIKLNINPLKPELNPICYLLALLAHHFLHVCRIRVKSLTLR